jgi:hypothetical protein
MNELTSKLPQDLQRALEQYYTSPVPRSEFASRLETQLRQNMERARNREVVPERISFMNLVQTRPLAAILIALLALLILSGVAYAVGKASGLIPGVGIVDQSGPLRILAEPIVVEKDGLTVTVSEVVADSDHTFVAYAVDGIIVPAEGRPICGAMPSLQLPNGSALSIVSVDDGGPQGGRVGSTLKLEQRITYSSLPAGVDAVRITFPCILPEGTGPENWQIPLKLSPAPKNYATPAAEVAATFIASNPTFVTLPTPTTDMGIFTSEPPDTLPATLTPVPNGSGLYLEKVVELPNSYILVGNFTDAGDLPGPLEINLDPHEDLPHIEDGSGTSVPFKVREDVQPEMGPGVRYWAYEIAKPVQGPLTITLDQVNIAVSDTTRFTFDVGPNPQVGQKWALKLPLHLRNYDYVIDSVEVIKDGYLFNYHTGIDVPQDLLLLNILGSSPKLDHSNVVRQKTVVEYSESFTYSAPLPAGQLTVELSLTESVPLRGPWTLTWTPPGK